VAVPTGGNTGLSPLPVLSLLIMQRYCFALDLKDDPALIAEYEAHHRQVWPEILESIRQSGITQLEIFRVENRLFMLLTATDAFSMEQKAAADAANARVQAWETLMWRYQQALPGSKPGEKWRLMDCIFQL
jgi:L-rhamnose mutarotase